MFTWLSLVAQDSLLDSSYFSSALQFNMKDDTMSADGNLYHKFLEDKIIK